MNAAFEPAKLMFSVSFEAVVVPSDAVAPRVPFVRGPMVGVPEKWTVDAPLSCP